MIEKRHFYINGEWVLPTVANDLAVINPATEEAIATISMGSEADVDKAVAAAKLAFDGYASTSHAERLALLEKTLAVFKSRQDDISEAIMLELGAPKKLAYGAQSGAGSYHLEGFIEAFKNMPLEQRLGNGDLLVREPIGVCGLITPWNWPINQVVLKVAAALAAGCTVVLKPSEITPLNALVYAEIMNEVGFPAGVFNLVNGDGPNVGAAISKHSDVDMMSFTGSTRGGVAVTKDAADTVKKVTLELGGKSPNIVFADCDVEKRVTAGVRHVFQNTGQSCNAPTRMLIEESIYEQAVEIARQTAESQLVAEPQLDGRHIGPLVSQMQFDKVQALIQAGIDEGAELIAGGIGRPDGISAGYFVKPTVFANANNGMRIAQEEIFGPVLTMISFKDEAEAIRIANDTEYGLAAQVQTGDPERAKRVALQLRAGMVHVNGVDMSAGSPFGGYKKSGVGREGGALGIEDFMEVKLISGV
jgi:aldehyde dehydrogenase (NAD+)